MSINLSKFKMRNKIRSPNDKIFICGVSIEPIVSQLVLTSGVKLNTAKVANIRYSPVATTAVLKLLTKKTTNTIKSPSVK